MNKEDMNKDDMIEMINKLQSEVEVLKMKKDYMMEMINGLQDEVKKLSKKMNSVDLLDGIQTKKLRREEDTEFIKNNKDAMSAEEKVRIIVGEYYIVNDRDYVVRELINAYNKDEMKDIIISLINYYTGEYIPSDVYMSAAEGKEIIPEMITSEQITQALCNNMVNPDNRVKHADTYKDTPIAECWDLADRADQVENDIRYLDKLFNMDRVINPYSYKLSDIVFELNQGYQTEEKSNQTEEISNQTEEISNQTEEKSKQTEEKSQQTQPKFRIEPEKLEKVREMLDKHIDISRIAEKLDISRNTVSKIKKSIQDKQDKQVKKEEV